jgi:hypothetical protein
MVRPLNRETNQDQVVSRVGTLGIIRIESMMGRVEKKREPILWRWIDPKTSELSSQNLTNHKRQKEQSPG